MVHPNRRSLICGIGINDSDYVARNCKLYKKWKAMIERCYSESFQKRFPWYKGCSVAKEWHTYSAFKKWAENQEWEGKALDKDLIKYGNKIYSPETCIFVTRDVNNFFNDRASQKGEHPIGISAVKIKDYPYLLVSCANPIKKRNKKFFKMDEMDKAVSQYWGYKKEALNDLIKNHKDIEHLLRLYFVHFKRDHLI